MWMSHSWSLSIWLQMFCSIWKSTSRSKLKLRSSKYKLAHLNQSSKRLRLVEFASDFVLVFDFGFMFGYVQCAVSLYSVMHVYCSAPNLSPTPTELWQWTAVRGSIIIHIPTTLYSLLYAIAIYSPGQQKKFNYSAPIRDIELKFWG